MYKSRKANATITTPYGIPYKELEQRCIFPLLGDPDYSIVHSLDQIRWSDQGKHFDFTFGVSAKDHDVTELEINLLLHKHCNVRKAFKL